MPSFHHPAPFDGGFTSAEDRFSGPRQSTSTPTPGSIALLLHGQAAAAPYRLPRFDRALYNQAVHFALRAPGRRLKGGQVAKPAAPVPFVPPVTVNARSGRRSKVDPTREAAILAAGRKACAAGLPPTVHGIAKATGISISAVSRYWGRLEREGRWPYRVKASRAN